MAITFVNKGTFASGAAGLTVALPASAQEGDLLLLFCSSANQAFTAPSGWTEVTNSPQGTGTAAAAGGVRLTVFYKFHGESESSVSLADSGDYNAAIILAYRGVDLVNPFDATPVGSVQGTAGTAATFPGITTATANARVVHGCAVDTDANSTATMGAATNANLSSITEQHDQAVNTSTGGGLVIIDGTKATAGATGNTTATGSTSVTRAYLTIALRDAANTTRSGVIANTTTIGVSGTAEGSVGVSGVVQNTTTISVSGTAEGTVVTAPINGVITDGGGIGISGTASGTVVSTTDVAVRATWENATPATSLVIPSSPVAGDTLVAIIQVRNVAATVDLPAGFIALASPRTDSGGHTIAVKKNATGSEGNLTFTCSHAAVGKVIALSNGDLDGQPDIAVETRGSNFLSSGFHSWEFPARTPQTAGVFHLAIASTLKNAADTFSISVSSVEYGGATPAVGPDIEIGTGDGYSLAVRGYRSTTLQSSGNFYFDSTQAVGTNNRRFLYSIIRIRPPSEAPGVDFNGGTWTQVATENSTFEADGTSYYRYGGNGAFLIGVPAAGTRTASNTLFGGDPIQGIAKVASVYTPPSAGISGVVTSGGGIGVSGVASAIQQTPGVYPLFLGKDIGPQVTYQGGETVFVAFGNYNNATASTLSDGTNTYSLVSFFHSNPGGDGFWIALYKADAVAAGTFTLTQGQVGASAGGTWIGPAAYRFSGLVSGAAQAVATNGGSAGGASVKAGPTVSATGLPAMHLIVARKQNEGFNWGVTAGFDDLGYGGLEGSPTHSQLRMAVRDATATGDQTSGWSVTGSAGFEQIQTIAATFSVAPAPISGVVTEGGEIGVSGSAAGSLSPLLTHERSVNLSLTGGEKTWRNRDLVLQSEASAFISGVISGSIDIQGSSAGAVRVAGAAAGTIGIAGAAAGSVRVAGAATGTIAITGSGAGSVRVSGQATGEIAVSGVSQGAVRNSGTVAGTLALTGTAQGSARIQGALAGSVDVTGQASGAARVQGAASGSIGITGTNAGSVRTQGAATGTIDLTGVSAGQVRIAGTSAQTIPITGTASSSSSNLGVIAGTVPVTGEHTGQVRVAGSSAATVSITGTAQGAARVVGSASGTVAVSGVAAGAARVSGASTGAVDLSGAAQGVARIQGSAAGTVVIDGTAAGTLINGRVGSIQGTIDLSGVASGAIRLQGVTASELAVLGAALGSVRILGESSSEIAIEGSADGDLAVAGAAHGDLLIQGSSEGLVRITALSSGEIVVNGVIVGSSGSIDIPINEPHQAVVYMRELQHANAETLLVFLADQTNTPVEDATPTVYIKKPGQNFSNSLAAVYEVGFGWYEVQLTAQHTDTQGELAVVVQAPGVKTVDLVYTVQPPVSNRVWAHPFVSKLLTVGKFLGLK